MCTTGALRLDGHDYLLFKNKDFGRRQFDDRLVLSQDVFGIKGISTWAGSDPLEDRFSGLSIGANRYGLFCADSNVREEPADGTNYDVLTEIALTKGFNVESALESLQDALAEGPYWCANLILVDPTTIAAVEIRGNDLFVTRERGHATRTNHHIHFGATESDHDTVTTQSRLNSSSLRLARASSISDVFELQGSHDDGPTGICNHSVYQTVYSYVLVRTRDETRLLVTKGHPCAADTRHELRIPFGDQWAEEAGAAFFSRFPSVHASPAAI